jgi:hypothetical protein
MARRNETISTINETNIAIPNVHEYQEASVEDPPDI